MRRSPAWLAIGNHRQTTPCLGPFVPTPRPTIPSQTLRSESPRPSRPPHFDPQGVLRVCGVTIVSRPQGPRVVLKVCGVTIVSRLQGPQGVWSDDSVTPAGPSGCSQGVQSDNSVTPAGTRS
eukprot:465240-Pyramimonas_sp.AAC.1